MKINFQMGLKALLLLCILSTSFSAQAFALTETETFVIPSSDVTRLQSTIPSAVSYTSIDLSDPAVYAGEQFRIFVGLKNTGKQVENHTIAIYRKDLSAPGGKVLMSSKELSLIAGQDKEVTFTLAPENLLVKGQPAPVGFVFIIGDQEIKVDYVK